MFPGEPDSEFLHRAGMFLSCIAIVVIAYVLWIRYFG